MEVYAIEIGRNTLKFNISRYLVYTIEDELLASFYCACDIYLYSY